MIYKDFYPELLTEEIRTFPTENQEFEVGDLVNIKGNRGGGGWEISNIEADGIYIYYGPQSVPTKFEKSKLYVVKKKEVDDVSVEDYFGFQKKSFPNETYVVKDFKNLGGDKWLEIREMENSLGKYTYSHEIRCGGKIVSVLPYRRVGKDAWEIGIREEITPCWNEAPSLSSVTGGLEGDEDPVKAAKRELLEETGYDVEESKFKSLGTCRGTKSSDTIYYLFGVDLTGIDEPKEAPKGDGTKGDMAPFKWTDINDSIVDPMVYVSYVRLGL